MLGVMFSEMRPKTKLATAAQRERLCAHPMYEEVSDEELEADVAAGLLTEASEEAQKVARNQGQVRQHCSLIWPNPSEYDRLSLHTGKTLGVTSQ